MPAPAKITDKREFNVSTFDGVNTQALRQAIKGEQQAWLENIIPIGNSNAKTVPAPTAALADIGALAGGARVPYYCEGFNILIGGVPTDILIIADTTGDIWQFNCNTNAASAISFGGARATFYKQCDAAQWQNSNILIIDNTNGLSDWNGAVLNAAGYTARPTTGQTIAVFSGRGWISNNRTVQYSLTNSFLDWGTAPAGSFILTDATLHSSVQKMISANNFLYIFGVDSVNVVSDPRVTAGPVLTFTNTNLSTGVGTPFPMSVVAYYRTLWFASASGFQGLYGSNTKKGSDELDGVYQLINNIATPPALGAAPAISAGLVTIYNILCLAFLFQYADPLVGNRQLLAVFFKEKGGGGKWFFASQVPANNNAITLMAGNLVLGANNLYGLDATGKIYQLFKKTDTLVPFKWQTALYDMGEPERDKQFMRAGIGALFSGNAATLSITADTENTSNAFTLAGGPLLQFIGAGGLIQFQNGGVNLNFIANGYSLLMGDVTAFGKYIGLTITGTAINVIFTLALLQYILRAIW